MESWSYWLKCGIIFSIIGLIIAIIFRLITTSGINLDGSFNAYLIALIATGPAFPLIILMFSLIGCNSFMTLPNEPSYCSNGIVQSGIILLSVIVSYFLIGSLIGWIYEKIKSKKSP